MRIGIDCRLWVETGIGRYIRNIVAEISKIDSENEYILFVLSKDLPEIELPKNFKTCVTDVRWYTLKEQIIMPFYFYKAKLDVLFCPSFNVPVFYLKPFYTTVHDLTILKAKTGRSSTLWAPLYNTKHFLSKLVMAWALRISKKIFTVSEFVKQDIYSTFHINPEKILITYNAVDSKFKPSSEAKIVDVKEKYAIEGEYIFYIGNAHPHKNLEKLIAAFEEVQKSRSNLKLVLAGKKDFFFQRMINEYKHKKIYANLVFPGFIDDEDLPALYSGALLYVNPSMHEGFGIQILEAFACRTKVVSSNATSLPEVGGNIAVYFNPKKVGDMKEKILLTLEMNEPSRLDAGQEWVKKFSWEKSAKLIFDCITS